MQLSSISKSALAAAGIVIVLAAVQSCGSGTGTSTSKAPPPPERRENFPEPPRTLAPGTAQIRGTAIAIDTIFTLRNGEKLKGPAAEYTVTFRIDSVKGYGMAFATPLYVGQMLPVTMSLPPAPPPPPPGRELPPPPPGMQRGLRFGDVVDGTVEYVNDPSGAFYRMMDFQLR